MKSKEELIEIVRVIISPYTSITADDEDIADKVVTALCKALPELTYELGRIEKGDSIVALDWKNIADNYDDLPNNAKELYKQLKEYGKDD